MSSSPLCLFGACWLLVSSDSVLSSPMVTGQQTFSVPTHISFSHFVGCVLRGDCDLLGMIKADSLQALTFRFRLRLVLHHLECRTGYVLESQPSGLFPSTDIFVDGLAWALSDTISTSHGDTSKPERTPSRNVGRLFIVGRRYCFSFFLSPFFVERSRVKTGELCEIPEGDLNVPCNGSLF